MVNKICQVGKGEAGFLCFLASTNITLYTTPTPHPTPQKKTTLLFRGLMNSFWSAGTCSPNPILPQRLTLQIREQAAIF